MEHTIGNAAGIGWVCKRLQRGLGVFLGLGAAACSGVGTANDTHDSAVLDSALISVQPVVSACRFFPWVPAIFQHCGDVTIASQADADQYQGIYVILGDLTIRGGHKVTQTDSLGYKMYKPGLEIVLPNLVQVTGTLLLDGDRSTKIELPNLARVGQDLNITLRRFVTFQAPSTTDLKAINTLLTPALTAVGRDITLQALRDPKVPHQSAEKQYEFGLDQVTSVGRDVAIENEELPGAINGLRGLGSIPGNLTIDWKDNDLESPSLMTQVTSVGGNLQLLASHNAKGFMAKLNQVGGHLEIARSPANPPDGYVALQFGGVFPKLETILGDLRLSGTTPVDCNNAELRSLKKVAGSVFIEGVTMDGRLGKTGANSLQLGGLEVRGSQGSPPFFPDLRLTASALVVFQDNPELCPCTINAFAESLAAGWAGTVTGSGNGGDTCTACPGCP